MDIRNLTEQEASDIYSAITGVDSNFIAALAKAAIKSAREVMDDLSRDATFDVAPGAGDVRQQARDYAGDLIRDFRIGLLSEIDAIEFEYTSKLVLKSELKF